MVKLLNYKVITQTHPLELLLSITYMCIVYVKGESVSKEMKYEFRYLKQFRYQSATLM